MSRDPRERYSRGIALHGDTPFEMKLITEVASNLWQGGVEEGLLLPEMFAHVVSLYPRVKYRYKHRPVSESYFRMEDDLEKVDERIVNHVARWVNICRESGPVLVHCQAGLNRSGLICARALMLDGATAKEAVGQLRYRRSPAVLCNPNFAQWLEDIDERR